jgi:hypothetical protein
VVASNGGVERRVIEESYLSELSICCNIRARKQQRDEYATHHYDFRNHF